MTWIEHRINPLRDVVVSRVEIDPFPPFNEAMPMAFGVRWFSCNSEYLRREMKFIPPNRQRSCDFILSDSRRKPMFNELNSIRRFWRKNWSGNCLLRVLN